ncbi:MAG: WYL domain-containing protein [Oscillospiraceae bacterium]|nr:WYL domain-containing protein [Oscillospiraceae bacterium]
MRDEDKAQRVLSLYTRFIEGKVINKEQESYRFGVAQRTIQRDFADIKRFLHEQNSKTGKSDAIVFDVNIGGYRLQTKDPGRLVPKEALAVCKVLLESRSLVKKEMTPIIKKILCSCGMKEDQKLVKGFIANEMEHYVELQHQKKLLDTLWELEQAVKEQRYVEIHYTKLKGHQRVVRKVRPVGIMFSEFYFYLTAFIEDINKEKEFKDPNDMFPTIYRIDRLESMQIMEEHFHIPYSGRFEEGEFRKRIQFMYGGHLKRIQFTYKGYSVEAILDRLPTAKVIEEVDDGIVIQAEVFGDGIDRWVKSQGDDICDLTSC